MILEVSQGDVWDIDFGEDDYRPGIVVSRNQLNRGALLLVVPCTASRVEERSEFSNNVFLAQGVGGLDENSVAQTHLIQPVKREFLRAKRDRLSSEELGEVLWALAWSVDWFDSVRDQ